MRRRMLITLGMTGEDPTPAAAALGEALEFDAQLDIAEPGRARSRGIPGQQNQAEIGSPVETVLGAQIKWIRR